MGMWDFAPWDNDTAADWFGDLMDRTKLRAEWLKGIDADSEESPEIVRAAGALFVMLGRVYVWPIDSYDDDLERAIRAMSRLVTCPEFEEAPELVEAVRVEIAELESRRRPKDPQTKHISSNRPWWKFW
jgi:hypothetical protein